jgi:hypothetical protein
MFRTLADLVIGLVWVLIAVTFVLVMTIVLGVSGFFAGVTFLALGCVIRPVLFKKGARQL